MICDISTPGVTSEKRLVINKYDNKRNMILKDMLLSRMLLHITFNTISVYNHFYLSDLARFQVSIQQIYTVIFRDISEFKLRCNKNILIKFNLGIQFITCMLYIQFITTCMLYIRQQSITGKEFYTHFSYEYLIRPNKRSGQQKQIRTSLHRTIQQSKL